MIDIAFLTSSPANLRTALINRNLIKADSEGGFVGVLPGVDVTWNSVSNPIPADTRKVFLMRLSAASDTADDDGSATQANDPTPRFTRSRLYQYVVANSTPETISGYRTYKLSATIWVIDPRDAGPMGAWQ